MHHLNQILHQVVVVLETTLQKFDCDDANRSEGIYQCMLYNLELLQFDR